MRKVVLIQVMLCLSLFAMGQVKAGDVIHGKVTDENGNPLSDAVIAEIGSNKRVFAGADSDINGDYSLKIENPKDTLFVSYHNLKEGTIEHEHGSKRVPITSSTINIVLELKRSSGQKTLGKSNASSAPASFHAPQANYDEYKQKMMDFYGLKLSIPAEMVDLTVFSNPNPADDFSFADMEESGGNIPVYIPGLFIRLDDNCKVVMQDLSFSSKPQPDHEAPINENTIKYHRPTFEGEMLNNCGLPWFHIDHSPGILNDKELMKKIEDARSKYTLFSENSKLQKQTNADRVSIVKIPFLDKIYFGADYLDCDSAEMANGKHSNIDVLNKEIWGSCDECYGVEFYRADRYMSCNILVFVNSKRGKSIKQYAEQLARYIYFDPNFKY